MKRKHIRAGSNKTAGPFKGVFYHQMHIERQLCNLADIFEYPRADSYIRHEIPVHYINVKEINARSFDTAQLAV